ncbi:MAG: type II toxin-antitoxin system RelB/DinJ family antitoxin [Victivallales bacterium]|nr:type II toxin-antitoxin system RelB/DinJ family antitoxin [Victivallales bacterium]
MVTVSLRFDEAMKRALDQMCDEMGMNLTTFFMIYARAALRERRIPFEIRAEKDPFYSEENVKAILQSSEQVKQGRVVSKSMDELLEMEK